MSVDLRNLVIAIIVGHKQVVMRPQSPCPRSSPAVHACMQQIASPGALHKLVA